jgi:tRNA(Ile)-lysidine synthetase-like protein
MPDRSGASAPYPKPSDIGGTLIRKLMALFKEQDQSPLLANEVFIAVSGGADSVVLAHLLCTYGRKILDPRKTTLLHFDHGWRKESANAEQNRVEALAQSLGVRFLFRKLVAPDSERMSQNLEEDARLKRQAVYEELRTENPSAFVLTAHHQDDAVESIFWRFLRGEFDNFRQGIMFRDSNCIRPFLKVSKEEIREYALAEKLHFVEDATNLDPKFFRGWMRSAVFPMLETQFPQVRKVLARYLTSASSVPIEQGSELTLAVQTVTGSRLNRAQRKGLHELSQSLKLGGTLSLPGDLQIRRTSEGFLIEKADRFSGSTTHVNKRVK